MLRSTTAMGDYALILIKNVVLQRSIATAPGRRRSR
jgi:hypothetical protein